MVVWPLCAALGRDLLVVLVINRFCNFPSRQTAVFWEGMNAMSEADDLTQLARRTIWWKTPEEALQDRPRLLAQIMASGTWRDVELARRHWDKDEFAAVLRNPPTGVFDLRSWAYWHTVLHFTPVPPLPRRRLP